ncbi:MAG: hypothetical protein WC383_14235, partial [Gammaproteobacteria bacterium]
IKSIDCEKRELMRAIYLTQRSILLGCHCVFFIALSSSLRCLRSEFTSGVLVRGAGGSASVLNEAFWRYLLPVPV